jgi:hypothetical protein
MILSLPLVGKIGAALFASESTASPATVQNTIQQKLLGGGGDASLNAASFSQVLNAIGQTSAPTPSISTAKL